MYLIKNKVKDLFLFFLILFSLFQTAELWLSESISRNSVFSFVNRYNFTPNSQLQGFMQPYRIVTSLGGIGSNHRFKITYERLQESHKRQLIDYSITLFLSEGQYVATHDTIDYARYLSYRSFIYEYSFNVPTNLFVEVFSPNSNLLKDRFDYFNRVLIAPSSTSSSLVYFIFMDTYNNMAYEYKLVRSGLNDMLNRELQNQHRNWSQEEDIYYVSSKLLGGLNLNNNIFLPMWRGQQYKYNPVRVVNRHYDTEPLIQVIGNNLSMFFDNPDSVWPNNRNGVFIFSDQNIVVQYHANNIVEYINYRQGTSQGDLLSDYKTAIRFISADTMVTNQFYLADFTQKNDKTIFYFNYIINNMPLIFTDEFKQDMGLNDISHAIEVTVERGVVSRYRKIAYTFEVDENITKTMDINLIDVVNRIAGLNVHNIRFGYNLSINHNIYEEHLLYLQWIIQE